MRYVSLTERDRREMLEAIGVTDVEDLFRTIPEGVRLKRPLEIPEAMAETDLLRHFGKLGSRNASAGEYSYFRGAGSYNHFIPTVVDALISRPEFYTAYTPYQAEISQGTLQAVFEYQTLICQLTGMEVSNASLYDGASALAEGVLMASRLTRRSRYLIPASLHPHYRQVLQTYLRNLGLEEGVVPSTAGGRLDLNRLQEDLSDGHAAVVVQSPNFYGVIEEVDRVAEAASRHGALVVVVVAEAVSLGLLKSPGSQGADIVVGEAQSFGIPMNFGGPYLGFFATRDRFKRQLPGRLAGQTVDTEGRRGFVLTLSAREQHIRREKATSNICTNQGLCALMAAVFLCALGKTGLRELAEQSLRKAHYLRSLLKDSLVHSDPHFNEMVVECGEDPREVNRALFREGIIGGLALGRYDPERRSQMLVCVTEQNRRSEIERFAEIFQSSRVAS